MHRLLEEAGKGLIPNLTEDFIGKRWDEIVSEIETAMVGSWVERWLVPIRDYVRDYEVRKIRAIGLSIEIVRALRSYEPPARRTGVGFEIWVQSRDGLVGGYIDQAHASRSEIIIKDFKTGQVYDPAEKGASLVVKEEYRTQLLIYASLYHSTFGRWPARLEIVPAVGPGIEISFDRRECDDLVIEAKDTLGTVNSTIHQSSNTEEVLHRLASPSPKACSWCLYRPACPAYAIARQERDDPGWPTDVWGRIKEIKKLGNERLLLQLSGSTTTIPEARIRGITANHNRHPALKLLSRGEKVGGFNLRRDRSHLSYREGLYTVLYASFTPAGR